MGDNDFLYFDTPFSEVIELATASNSKARECMQKRSSNPFDYMEYFSLILKFIGENDILLGDEGQKKRSKNNEESRKLREQGNKIFVSKSNLECFEEVLELYTKSIAYAVPNTKEMALGFANRSAVLIKLNRPKESLEDIERALNSNYPEEIMYKLHYRRAECYSILVKHSCIQSKYWLNDVPVYDPKRETLDQQLACYSEMDYESTVDEQLVVPEIELPNAKFPCASDAIDVEYSGHRGKKIVATRDIKAGEVLVVEKPYLVLSKDYLHCAHCLEGYWAGIPCEGCVNAVYCSEKCKKLAWEEYHIIECSVFNLLDQEDKRRNSLAFHSKVLIKMTIEAGGLEELKKRIMDFQKNNGKYGELQREWYEKQSLESILTLTSNIKKITNDDFLGILNCAMEILPYLARANFFDMKGIQKNMSNNDVLLLMSQDPDFLFAAGLLLDICLINTYNMRSTDERGIDKQRVSNKSSSELVPFVDLFSFSCYNNADRQFVGEHVVVHSIAPIAKGEEVFMHIGYLWPYEPKDIRHQYLATVYQECTCKVCNENWPLLNDLENYDARAKSQEMKVMLKKVMKPFPLLREKVLDGDISDKESTLTSLKKMSEAIYKGVNLPCYEQALLSDALHKFYYFTGNTSKIQSIQRQFK